MSLVATKIVVRARWQIRLLAVAVILVALVFLLFAGEFIMRSARPDLVPSNQLRMIPDPLIGWRFEPNQRMEGKTEDGRLRRVRTNTEGFADEDFTVEDSNQRIQIAFLGDSFTAATHVDYDDAFVSVAGRLLQEKEPPRRRVKTMNFGQTGFGTANEYLCWKHEVSKFEIHAVILAFFLGNDVANNLVDYPTESFRSPKFKVVDGKLMQLPFEPGPGAEAERRRKRSWFYRAFLAPSVLYQQYKLFERDLRARFRPERARRVDGKDVELPLWKRSYAPLDWQTYLRQPEPDFEAAWKVTELLILTLRDEVWARGASFYVALLPGTEVLEPEVFKASFSRYPGIEKFDFDLDGPRQRLLKFLADHQIPVIDLTPPFREYQQKNPAIPLYFKFDRHFSVEGHHLAGEITARELATMIRMTNDR